MDRRRMGRASSLLLIGTVCAALAGCASFSVPTELDQARQVAETVSGLSIPEAWTPVTDGDSLQGSVDCVSASVVDCASASMSFTPAAMPASIDELTAVLPNLKWTAPVQECDVVPDVQIGQLAEAEALTTCYAEADTGVVSIRVSMVGVMGADGKLVDPRIDVVVEPTT